jgi:putative cardiolipin synthase
MSMKWPVVCAAAALTLALVGCAGLPSLEGRMETAAVADTDATRLGRAVARHAAAHPGKSGIHALPVASDAFVARYVLAAAAEKSLDVQYYIWRGDETGHLLFEALWQAAGRGVRVRLLLDDINTGGLDPVLAALDAHPLIEVRLYNPFANRTLRALNFLTDFGRVNRRMHNKSFTADNEATIVGGRNIGNEYFGATSDVAFADLDVIAVGPVVREVSAAFDLYWNSASAYPLALFTGAAEGDATAWLQARFAEVRAGPKAVAYVDALRETPLLAELLEGRLPLEWTEATLLRDDPAKTLDPDPRGGNVLLLPNLLQDIGRPVRSLELVSPYFVPGADGAAALGALAGRGVRVRILTNSLAATDVSAVHAGYARRRRGLLEAGVQLYELKPTAAGSEPEAVKRKLEGSSSASLHAKTFAVDGRRIFVGSLNFDQRSALLNTEMGLLIGSPALAQRLAGAFDTVIPAESYEVRFGTEGQLEWVSRDPPGEIRYSTEPDAGFLKRLWIRFLSVLPIEWLL